MRIFPKSGGLQRLLISGFFKIFFTLPGEKKFQLPFNIYWWVLGYIFFTSSLSVGLQSQLLIAILVDVLLNKKKNF
ncbi:MAG: hypothetical protein CM15mP70_11360 [Pelagibacteraceae bacterium]|nr:MAG: hypothetical protein CM15mP70_11360 [Pelagibacteraceae bacterium]